MRRRGLDAKGKRDEVKVREHSMYERVTEVKGGAAILYCCCVTWKGDSVQAL